MPQLFDDVGEIVEEALRRVGKTVVLALPLGIGKPNLIANEFFRRARADAGLDLTIFTALSLRKPTGASDLERRFVGPLADRLFGNYPDLDYLAALRADDLPPNVRVIEFFFEPGSLLDSPAAQSQYLCANYTHVARELLHRGVNVIAHMVAKRVAGGVTEISLGSNPDVTVDLLPEIARLRAAGNPVVMLGQVHRQMPFMLGAANVGADTFDLLLDHSRFDYDLFAPPNPALGLVDHAIGLHASALVRDGGTLQIGIGELGDSVVYSVLLRHQQNEAWRQALAGMGDGDGVAALIDAYGGRTPFSTGLFGATEMFVDQMLDLYRAGILRRRVYDYLPLQRVLAANDSNTRVDEQLLEALLAAGAGPQLRAEDVAALRAAGVFRGETGFDRGHVVSPDGNRLSPDLGDVQARAALARECLGLELQGGVVMQAGFLLGPRAFYAALNALPESERRLFDMRGVGYINQLYGDQDLKVAQRCHARFVNTTMMLTTLGAAVSDGLADGRVVSGVGGQYNFVTMAHALPGARSILCVRATRLKDGAVTSNIVAGYGHCTIPRHLRDIAITEYGIADLRGRTDAECVAAMINIADSRFQDQLLRQAKRSHKIDAGYRVPDRYRHNTPDRLQATFAPLKRAGLFSEYPFGTDLTREEIDLARALRWLKENTATSGAKVRNIVRALFTRPNESELAYLDRLNLRETPTYRERLTADLVVLALRETAATASARTTVTDP